MRFFILSFLFTILISINAVAADQGLSDTEYKVSDPLEPVNRVIWYFNYDILDHYVFRPTTELYVNTVWDDGRGAINNFVLNLQEPSNIVNNLIQLDIKHSADAFVRFIINSTVGLLGFIDIAKMGGIERRHESFSNVLGSWDVPNGPYLMVPLLGPRSTRKLVGNVVDSLYFPFSYFTLPEKGGLLVLDGIDKREKALSQDKLIAESLDSYQFVKQAYIQHEIFKFNESRSDSTESSVAPKEPQIDELMIDEDLDDFMNEID